MNPNRQYYWIFVISLFCQVLAVVSFNAIVDPYVVFNSPKIFRFNQVKKETHDHARLFKAMEVIRIRPKTVFLGFSRTEFGLDPDHPALADRQPAYNLAIPGANMYEAKRYFQHALYLNPDLDLVVIGLDFMMFSAFDQIKPDFKETRLETDKIEMSDLLEVLFSIDSLLSSLKTIKANLNYPNDVGFYYPNGLRDPVFFKKQIFPGKSNKSRFNTVLKQQFEFGKYTSNPEEFIAKSAFNDLKEILEICRKKQIEVKLFISPVHVTLWEARSLVNLWPAFGEWKRELVKIAPVWDFSGYNSITTEEITEKDMENYIDPSHYTKEVGDLILNKIFQVNLETVPKDFGSFITEDNIEIHLKKIENDRQKWLQQNPKIVEYVKSLQN